MRQMTEVVEHEIFVELGGQELQEQGEDCPGHFLDQHGVVGLEDTLYSTLLEGSCVFQQDEAVIDAVCLLQAVFFVDLALLRFLIDHLFSLNFDDSEYFLLLQVFLGVFFAVLEADQVVVV